LFPAGQQGRYVYGGLLGLLVLASAGFARLLGRRATVLPLLVLVVGLGATLVQFALGMRIYYTPRHHVSYWNDLTEGSRNLLAWSTLTPVWFWLAVAATVVVAAVAVGVAAREVSARPSRTPRPTAA
jgi:hypothetical protein